MSWKALNATDRQLVSVHSPTGDFSSWQLLTGDLLTASDLSTGALNDLFLPS